MNLGIQSKKNVIERGFILVNYYGNVYNNVVA